MSDSEVAEAFGPASIGELSAGCGKTAFFVTKGRRGSEVWQEGRRTEIPAIAAAVVVDVTGAGDAYCAGVVAALARGSEAEDAALLGAACASVVVESYGGQSGVADLQAAFRRLGRGAPAAVARLQERWTESS
jgi:adenosine kinase